MADLKTTAEERARFRAASLSSNNDRARVTRILDDLEAVLAENEGLSGVVRALNGAEAGCIAERKRLLAESAKLRAVAEAARDACNISLNDAGPEAFATIADLRRALAALEAP